MSRLILIALSGSSLAKAYQRVAFRLQTCVLQYRIDLTVLLPF